MESELSIGRRNLLAGVMVGCCFLLKPEKVVQSPGLLHSEHSLLPMDLCAKPSTWCSGTITVRYTSTLIKMVGTVDNFLPPLVLYFCD